MITITGSEGFIGKHLQIDLPKDIYLIDLVNGDDIFDKKFESIVRESDAVYHLAAITSVEQSFKEYDKVFRTNVLGTAHVAYLCQKYNKKLIYPSSAAIYHHELSPYAYTKYLAEKIVEGISKSTPTVILRLFNVFGDDMNPNSGSIMYNFLTSKKIIVFGDGEQTRDFIHVRDVVSIMKDCLKKKWDGQIVDVGTGEHYSTNYIAGLFAYLRKKKIEYKPPRREIKWSIADRRGLDILYKKRLKTNIERDIKKLCQTKI